MANETHDDKECLHCDLAQVISDFLEHNDTVDISPAFAAMAAVIGDLLASNEAIFSERENIILGMADRSIARARRILNQKDQQTGSIQ